MLHQTPPVFLPARSKYPDWKAGSVFGDGNFGETLRDVPRAISPVAPLRGVPLALRRCGGCTEANIQESSEMF
jgi:hypothetical protein